MTIFDKQKLNVLLIDRKDRSLVVSIRIPEGIAKRIELDVEQNGDHASRADWIIAAIREYEKQRTSLIAQRKIAESVTQKQNESQLGSIDLRTSAESNAINNR